MSRELGVVEDTLYVPMLGRIYASENCRNILYNEKDLDLKTKLPEGLIGNDTQTQYTYLASAARSANMDRYIADFLKRKPDGIIVQLGCGLETTYYRGDNGRTKWYGIDLPNVIEYRKTCCRRESAKSISPGMRSGKNGSSISGQHIRTTLS